jgi:hypothetical protein
MAVATEEFSMGKARPRPIGSPTAGRPRREPDWVAWTHDGSRPLARASTFEEAREAARALGEPDPILEPAQIPGRRA